jgi:hypothetical protein
LAVTFHPSSLQPYQSSEGAYADVLLVEGNPLEDISILGKTGIYELSLKMGKSLKILYSNNVKQIPSLGIRSIGADSLVGFWA